MVVCVGGWFLGVGWWGKWLVEWWLFAHAEVAEYVLEQCGGGQGFAGEVGEGRCYGS